MSKPRFDAEPARLRRVCVFAGSRTGSSPDYPHAAERLGRELAHQGIGLVYGGASVGLMGAMADSALHAGGEVIGVIPSRLVEREVAHPGLSELRVSDTMHERKAEMGELSDAFIALPGGLGTLEELFEVATWTQLGIHSKPCGLLNVNSFFDPLISLLDRAIEDSFLAEEHRDILLVDTDPASLLDRLSRWISPLAKGSDS